MPDASHLISNPPGTWTEAFAALPQEAPPRDAWAKVSRKLDTRRRKRRPLPAWLGIAAAAAVVAVIAWPHTPAPDDATRRAGAHQDATPTNQTAVANQGTTPMNSIVGATEVAT